MEKLTRLTARESSSEEALDGSYHITIDLNVAADKKVTLEKLQKVVSEVCDVEDFFIEKYSSRTSAAFFNVGDTIELLEEVTCTKPVYIDASGSLVISDKPATEVEKVGDFVISLEKGTIAEINTKPSGDTVEVLFAPEAMSIPELEKVAYIGVLELPLNILAKADL